MKHKKQGSTLVILAHAFVGWGLCGAIMGIGPTLLTMETTLMIYAIGAPVIFAAVSRNDYKRFGYTTPFQTALIFGATYLTGCICAPEAAC